MCASALLDQPFQCECGKGFTYGKALRTHQAANCEHKGDHAVPDAPKPGRRGKARRLSHTFAFKLRALMMLVLATSIDATRTDVGATMGINASLFPKWEQQSDDIAIMVAIGQGNRKRLNYTPARFPDEEERLYVMFFNRRFYQGYRVDNHWLRWNMRALLRESKPPGWSAAKLSNGWLQGFCKRYSISDQAKTNTKSSNVHDRIPYMQKFHQFLLYDLQWSAPQRCPKYGRFPGHLMFHCDQIPIPFSNGRGRSLNMQGFPCRLKGPYSGAEKRMATLHLTIRAEGEQIVTPILIFRGTGKRISALERSQYPTNIRIFWQPKAWVDESVMEDITTAFELETAELRDRYGEVLLGMDNHGPHRTRHMLDRYWRSHIVPLFTPYGCTDCVSPCDKNVGQHIKESMGVLYEDCLERYHDHWEEGVSAPARRILIAQWLSAVWKQIQAESADTLIRSAFVKSGFLLAKDGSENHLISIHKNVHDYTVPYPDMSSSDSE